jgi:hypothetical protein
MNPTSTRALLFRNHFARDANGGVTISTHPLAAKKPRPPIQDP